MEYIKRIKQSEKEQVIKIVTLVGGRTEESPVREETQYWTVDGKFIGTI